MFKAAEPRRTGRAGMPDLQAAPAQDVPKGTYGERYFMTLEIIYDPERKGGPYHVQTSSGMTLASFKTKTTAGSYRRSRLLEIALDLQLTEISDRRNATEEETLS